MEQREEIKQKCRGTIGYQEAKNKESFLTGVSVAITLTEMYYKDQINELTTELAAYKNSYNQCKDDLLTLSSIINKYSNND